MNSPHPYWSLSCRDQEGPVSGDRKSQELPEALHLEVSIEEAQLSVPLSVMCIYIHAPTRVLMPNPDQQRF